MCIILKKSHSFSSQTLCKENAAGYSYKTLKYEYIVGRLLSFQMFKADGAYT
jgi:predicted glycosyltransferase involved in capsule biosynthesis